MASPGNILDITYSLVGSIDSSYFGVTRLDSADTRLKLNNDITNKAYSVDGSIMTFPNPLSVHQISGSTNLASGSGSGDGGGDDTIVERWF